MKQHFVTFLSPGTFVHEETTLPIKSWDVDEAVKMSKTILERHNSKPFAFQFSTRARTNKNLDSKVIKTSPRYYLGGRIMTLPEVEREMPTEQVLQDNMRFNHWDTIVVNTNSWRISQPLQKGDVVLAIKPTHFKSP